MILLFVNNVKVFDIFVTYCMKSFIKDKRNCKNSHKKQKTITVKVNIKYILHKTSIFELTYRIHFLWLIAYQSWGSFFDVLTRNYLRRTSIWRRIVGLQTNILCLSVCLYLSVCLFIYMSLCLPVCLPFICSSFRFSMANIHFT